MSEPPFPFAAVVGHDDAKLALLLNAVDPRVGGVLLRGHKGTAKSTLARGLATLLERPFVELPLGATEDRVIGSLDVASALGSGEIRVLPGLLAAAHGGVLYVDEVNLLADHLVDALLDVAASGVNRIEREGVSHEHESRFVLVGSMNPEEGELRPQLLDRFGLAVDVVTEHDVAGRAEAVRRRLAFDDDPQAFAEEWGASHKELRERLETTVVAGVDDGLRAAISALCAAVGAEGLRADLTITRAAAALAGWDGRDQATPVDVRRVAPLALAHRRRRSPFDEPGMSQQELDDALDNTLAVVDPGERRANRSEADAERSVRPGAGGGQPPPVAEAGPPSSVFPLETRPSATTAAGRRSLAEGSRGRLVADRPPAGPVSSIALGATARAAALRQSVAPSEQPIVAADLREAVREQRVGNLLILAVDVSGSMGAEGRMEAAKGAVLSLLLDAYQRRDRVALVTFQGDEATVVLRPTSSVEVAQARIADVPTGGRTPLAAGIDAARKLAVMSSDGARRPLVVLLSDGRATSAPGALDAVAAAMQAADAVRRAGIDAVVVDAEDGAGRLGLARDIAVAMGARYLTIDTLTGEALAGAVRSTIRGRP